MTDDDTDEVERLREAFRALSATARPTSECPEPERLWRAARGELGPGDLRDVIDHTSRCWACAEAWRLAAGLADEAPRRQATPPLHAVRQRWQLAAIAATIALAVGIGFRLTDSPDRPLPPASVRGVEEGVVSALPADEALPRDDFVLRWRLEPAVEGARYEVVVTTQHDLALVVRERNLEAPELRIPPPALAGLPAGTGLRWQVIASDDDGDEIDSAAFLTRLE